tara:strand:+ start:535 stop:1185 length:651 start_codon:yes stop_codon:yes gene_type:complete
MEELVISLTSKEKKYCNEVFIINKIPQSLINKIYEAHSFIYSKPHIGMGIVKSFDKWLEDLNGGYIYILEKEDRLLGYTATQKIINKNNLIWAKKIGTAGLVPKVGTTMVLEITNALNKLGINIFTEINFDREDLKAIHLRKCAYEIITDINVIRSFFNIILDKNPKFIWLDKQQGVYSRHTSFLGMMPPKILVMKWHNKHFFTGTTSLLRKALSN